MRLTTHTVKNGSRCRCHLCSREDRQKLQGLCSFEVWILICSVRHEDPPPPYESPCAGAPVPPQPHQPLPAVQSALRRPQHHLAEDSHNDPLSQSLADLDLLANCQNFDHQESDDSEQQKVQLETSFKPIKMGQKTSLLTGRHRSKVSLTWVLRERSDVKYSPCNYTVSDNSTNIGDNYNDRYPRKGQKMGRDVTRSEKDGRFIGRNNPKLKAGNPDVHRVNRSNENNRSSVDCYEGRTDRWMEMGADCDGSYSTSSKRHRHRRRKARTIEKNHHSFGYEIKDIDCFLAEATIDNPGNIPVVLTLPSLLYQTQRGRQREVALSLGTVVNAVFRNRQWLYVQTPHGQEGYVLYAACLPLGILPQIQRPQSGWKAAPCWESTLDLYPQPCGNMTDSEKEQLRGGTRSECGRPQNKHKAHHDTMSMLGEKTIDKLYLKATSSCSKLNTYEDNKIQKQYRNKNSYVTRHTLLVVEMDYVGEKIMNTLSVRKGDVVILLQGAGIEADVDSEWFYVRNKEGIEGFIPAAIAGHGFL